MRDFWTEESFQCVLVVLRNTRVPKDLRALGVRELPTLAQIGESTARLCWKQPLLELFSLSPAREDPKTCGHVGCLLVGKKTSLELDPRVDENLGSVLSR